MLKDTCHEVLAELGMRNNALLKIAMKLEEIA